jgi:hypothetical protein
MVQKYINNADLKVILQQEDKPGDWDQIVGSSRIQAITDRDSNAGRTGDRLKVPETITFHPLWIKLQRTHMFDGWDQDLFDKVTAKDAAKVYEAKGKTRGNSNAVPADGLLEASFVRNVFHEVSASFSVCVHC